MLVDHTNSPMMRLVVNEARQVRVYGPALAEVHRSIGRALATALATDFMLEEVAIDHVAGLSMGVQIKSGAEPIIIAILRAGLFLAEGIWMALPGSSLALYGQKSELEAVPSSGRVVVVVDSVINTGKSIRGVLECVAKSNPLKISVAAVVAYKPSLDELIVDFPNVDFHVARVSDRSYVGNGSTDTGSRLFCTTNWGGDY